MLGRIDKNNSFLSGTTRGSKHITENVYSVPERERERDRERKRERARGNALQVLVGDKNSRKAVIGAMTAANNEMQFKTRTHYGKRDLIGTPK